MANDPTGPTINETGGIELWQHYNALIIAERAGQNRAWHIANLKAEQLRRVPGKSQTP
jgi:hypothetical protein